MIHLHPWNDCNPDATQGGVTGQWALGALIVAVASLVHGLAGFGIGLVALAFLPLLMSPVTAVVLMTIYAAVFSVGILLPLRREVQLGALTLLVLGTIAGAPAGVWLLAALPVSVLTRLIGLTLIGIVLLEWLGGYPERLTGRGWALGAGVAAGVAGGAVGTPGPPVVLYAASQGWSPRAVKATLQAFFVVNQGVILLGYWWAGLLTREVWQVTALFLAPAALGLVAGIALFNRVDQARFRRIVFAVLFASGAVLLARG
jgi:uncharacterized membrane protein YfcA